MEIQEQVVNGFENEKESLNFLTREFVNGKGGVIVELRQVTKRNIDGKYDVYSLHVTMENNAYTISNVFRSQMKWGKIANPKLIHVSVEPQVKDGKTFQNWVIKPYAMQ